MSQLYSVKEAAAESIDFLTPRRDITLLTVVFCNILLDNH